MTGARSDLAKVASYLVSIANAMSLDEVKRDARLALQIIERSSDGIARRVAEEAKREGKV